MNKTLTIIILTIALLSMTVLADSEQYLTQGVTRDSTYQQDGNGYWTGLAGNTYQRSGDYRQFGVVADVDNDGINELMIMKGGNVLEILNYTTGIGILLEASVDIGNTSYHATPYYQTPGLIDYDADNLTEIIMYNSTHALAYEWNTTDLTQEKAVATAAYPNGSGNVYGIYPVIKCAAAAQWNGLGDSCAFPIRHRNGTAGLLCTAIYDVDNDYFNYSCSATLANSDQSRKNTHLADVDNDGYLEVLYSFDDEPNDDYYIIKTEVAAGTVTYSTLYSHIASGTTDYTDMIASNLDGTLVDGMEITYGFTDDGTNWYARTINSAGAVEEADYATILSAPEGNVPSVNLWTATDTTYSDYSNDVCYYLRSYTNTDYVMCVSLYAGAAFKKSTVTNTQNSTHQNFVHQASLYGSTGILLNEYALQGTTKQALPALQHFSWTIPVDISKAGGLDIIGGNASRLTLFDDSRTNQNYQITNLAVDTGNPVCQNELVTATVSLSDNESDSGSCLLEEYYVNDTLKSSPYNITVNPFVADNSLDYYADEVGTYKLKISCKDQYHTTYASKTYSISVSNDTTNCNLKGDDPFSEAYETTEQAAAEEEFDDKTDEFWDGIGASSRKARNAIAIFVALLVAVGIFMKTGSGMISVASVPCVLLLSYFIGLATIFPVVVMIIFTLAFLVYFVMTGRGTPGG